MDNENNEEKMIPETEEAISEASAEAVPVEETVAEAMSEALAEENAQVSEMPKEKPSYTLSNLMHLLSTIILLGVILVLTFAPVFVMKPAADEVKVMWFGANKEQTIEFSLCDAAIGTYDEIKLKQGKLDTVESVYAKVIDLGWANDTALGNKIGRRWEYILCSVGLFGLPLLAVVIFAVAAVIGFVKMIVLLAANKPMRSSGDGSLALVITVIFLIPIPIAKIGTILSGTAVSVSIIASCAAVSVVAIILDIVGKSVRRKATSKK